MVARLQAKVSNHELAGAHWALNCPGMHCILGREFYDIECPGFSHFPSTFASSNKNSPIPSLPSASQQLKEFEFRATLRFMFKLGEPIPCIDAIVVALASDPKVHALGFQI